MADVVAGVGLHVEDLTGCDGGVQVMVDAGFDDDPGDVPSVGWGGDGERRPGQVVQLVTVDSVGRACVLVAASSNTGRVAQGGRRNKGRNETGRVHDFLQG